MKIDRYTTLNEALIDNATDERFVNFIESKTEETKLTYKQLHDRALSALYHFQQNGITQGDQCIFFLRNNQKFVEAFWGCLLGGIAPVPVAVGISDEHRSKVFRIFKRLSAPYLLVDEKELSLLKRYAEENQLESEFAAIESRALMLKTLDTFTQQGAPAPVKSGDLAFIQFSSGSTREPKGVYLTHKNLLTTIVDIGNRARYQPNDVSLSWMPLTHDMGLIGFQLNMVVFGMNQHVMATDLFSRRPLVWMEKASEKKATILCSPNFGYKHYLSQYLKRMADVGKREGLEGLDLSSVRLIYNGAEPISIGLCHQFLDEMARHGLPRSAMYTVYGLAEGSLAISLPEPGKEFEFISVKRSALALGEKVTYVACDDIDAVHFAVEGPAVDHCQICIGDKGGRDLGEDVIGEILIKGPNVTSGYFNDPEHNAHLFTDEGWLRTGDLGLLHNGQLIVTGRLKDIIFVSGQNYFPQDLEAVALQEEGLELGKVVAAAARDPEATEDDILIFVLHRTDIDSFIPLVHSVKQAINEHCGIEVKHVVPVPRIPKTTSGKIQRRFLVDAYLAGEYTRALADIDNAINPAEFDEDEDENEIEATIQRACDRVVEEKKIHLHDNFFEVGLSSLELAQIHEQIEETYPGILDITDIFDHPTIAELAAFVESKT